MAFLLLLASLFLALVRASPLAPSDGAGKINIKAARNPNYNPNGPAVYAKALTKWGVKLPEGLAKYASNRGQIGSLGAVPFSDDREYISEVGIGTPPQTLPLDLDTGSSDFWVYSSETQSSDLGNHTFWQPENSTTAVQIPNSTWSIQYGDQSFAYGTAWRDTLDIAGIKVPKAVVESAIDVSPSLAEDLALCGLFGLAFNISTEVIPHQPSVLSTLLPLLDSQVFTVDLRYHATGTYAFGHIDHAAYTGSLHYVPLIDKPAYWEIEYSGFNVEGNPNWYLSSWNAIVDTGTSLLMLQEDIVRLYYAEVPSARYNSTYGIWQYPCSITELPDFKMGFGAWHTAVPGKYLNYTVLDDDEGTCMGGLQSNQGQVFGVIGDIFIKAVFIVFDVANKQVGFADKVRN